MLTFTSCSLWTLGPSGDERIKRAQTRSEGHLSLTRFLAMKRLLTLSCGAPAGDGALHELRQWRHPDVDGSDKLIENQWMLKLHQGQVALFSAGVVSVVADDPRDSDQLRKHESETCSYSNMQTPTCSFFHWRKHEVRFMAAAVRMCQKVGLALEVEAWSTCTPYVVFIEL